MQTVMMSKVHYYPCTCAKFLTPFSNHSNCKINLSECQTLHIVSNRNFEDKLFIDEGLRRPTETFKYFCVSLPIKKRDDDTKTLPELNSVSLVNKAKNISNLSSSRNLT